MNKPCEPSKSGTETGPATVNVGEAKAQFSKLLARAEAGEDIVIARDGVPVARLTALKKEPRKPGRARHWVDRGASPDALLEPLSEEDLDAAEGRLSDAFGVALPEADRRR